MKNIIILFSLSIIANLTSCKEDLPVVLPSESQITWADCEIGVIIHLDINIFDPDNFVYSELPASFN